MLLLSGAELTDTFRTLSVRIEWNSFIEDVEEALAELPEKFHPLVALMVHES